MPSPLPLLLAGGAAILLLGGKKKSSSKSKCSPAVTFDSREIESIRLESVDPDVGDKVEINTFKSVVDGVTSGNKDIISLSEKLFEQQGIPRRCIWDPNVTVTAINSKGDQVKMTAPVLFFMLTLELIEDLGQAQLITADEAMVNKAALVGWWDKYFPGKKIPHGS